MSNPVFYYHMGIKPYFLVFKFLFIWACLNWIYIYHSQKASRKLAEMCLIPKKYFLFQVKVQPVYEVLKKEEQIHLLYLH